MMEKIALSWSSGKDSAMSLHYLKQQDFEVKYLITTITIDYNRVSMHGVREELLDLQSNSLGIPIRKVFIPTGCRDKVYEESMKKICLELKEEGITKIAFGDIFLEDIKKYREGNLKKVDMEGIFPIWQKSTKDLSKEFITLGYKAKVVCIDLQKLAKDFVGREYDELFLADLPLSCDPCGENGEFHTFVYNGPIFSKPIYLEIGEKVLRDNRFYFCDLFSLPNCN